MNRSDCFFYATAGVVSIPGHISSSQRRVSCLSRSRSFLLLPSRRLVLPRRMLGATTKRARKPGRRDGRSTLHKWICALVCGYVILIPMLFVGRVRQRGDTGAVDIASDGAGWKSKFDALQASAALQASQLSGEIEALRSARSGAANAGSAAVGVGAARVASRSVDPQYAGKTIGVGVTVLNDGPFFDGAAVLQQSVLAMKSKYPIEFFALCHPNAVKSPANLRALGFKIITRSEPVHWPEGFTGATDWYKEEVHKNGCCGELEFLKLEAYTLTQYHRVLLLDMDTLIVKNIDELFDIDASLVYTPDPDMSGSGVAAPMFQGGFMLVQPSRATYDAFVKVAREGDFRPGSGWGGKNVGWGYGGATIQGILPYYYTFVAPGTGHELDACVYNQMYSQPCRTSEWDKVKSVHFTNCQKPWKCNVRCSCSSRAVRAMLRAARPPPPLSLTLTHTHTLSLSSSLRVQPLPNDLCRKMHKSWWGHRGDLEREQGWPVTPQCGNGVPYKYLPLK